MKNQHVIPSSLLNQVNMKNLLLFCLATFFTLNYSFAQEKSMSCTPTISNGPIQIGGMTTCIGNAGQIQFNGTNYQVWDPIGRAWVNFGNPATSNLWTLNANGLDIFRNNRNVGIGSVFNSTTAALSPLSVGGQGDNLYASYFTRAGNTHGATGVYAQIPLSNRGGGDYIRGVVGDVPSGAGWTHGIVGSSTNPMSNTSGRAYGVLGVAGNATDGANYGVVGRINGSNDGAGIVGVDGNLYNHEYDQGAVPGFWAGYFLGNSYFSDKVIIGRRNIPTTATAGGITYPVNTFGLYVEGGVLTEELIVTDVANWADYVFAPDYQLTSLEEVEAHIAENGHLHNTPSAAEIAETGLDMKEITVNQQEKIEELFLHVIELSKQVKALQAENTALKAARQ